MTRLNAEEIVAKAKQLKETLQNSTVEIVGKWIWVSFASDPGHETRDILKSHEARWNRERRLWQISNGYWSKKSVESDDNLRFRYGSQAINTESVEVEEAA